MVCVNRINEFGRRKSTNFLPDPINENDWTQALFTMTGER